LTLSYAILVATILTIALGTFTPLVVKMLKGPLADQMEAAARAGRNIVASAPAGTSETELEADILRRVSRPGIVVFPLPPFLRPGFPPRPPGGIRAAPFADPPFGGKQFQFRLSRIDLPALIAGRPVVIPVGRGGIVIAPEPARIEWAIRTYLEAVGTVILLVVGVAWFIASSITNQAIRPLVDVTAQLRRFAAGDFSPRRLTTSDRSEIGELIEAYNGAAAQVVAAFSERAAAEEHMRRFVADAGHELRTPLCVIAGSNEVLRKGALENSDLRERIFRNLDAETHRMKALVDRLVALARLERPEHPEREPLDVALLAREVVEALHPLRDGSVTICGSHEAPAYADRSDVYDALGNLIDNALKYGAEGPVRIDVATTAQNVVVTVSDRGPGIPPGDRPHIFERFYRGWIGRSYGGSGLGLAIARRSAERAGGTLELLCGEPGKTSFSLTLPRSEKTILQTIH